MIVLAVALLALCAAPSAQAADRTVGTASGPCKDQFNTVLADNYAADNDCATAIKKAMSTAPATPADCPGGAVADVGSQVQKCLSKSDASKAAWTSFIKACEVLNVNERTGAGEAEAATTAKPSCLPRFDSLKAFTSYLDGNAPSSAKSAAGAAATASSALLVAAAAAGAALLL